MVVQFAVMVLFLLPDLVSVAQLPPLPDQGDGKKQSYPLLFVEQRRLDLGMMLEGDLKTVEWLIENRGTADLIIEDTKASCGCTMVILEKKDKTIPPGGTLVLRAVFDSKGRLGRQSKGISVYTNDPAEPKLSLHFNADVKVLYEVRPAGLVNLQSVQRGQPSRKTIDFLPGPDRGSLKIIDVSLPKRAPVKLTREVLVENGRIGERLRITIDNDTSLGRLMTKASIKIVVDGVERTREVTIRGNVIGDLSWNPKILDNTRQRSRPGKQFAPVRIRSQDKSRFDILSATAEPLFDVTVKAAKSGPKGSQYVLYMTLREGAAPGPFGTTLIVRTTALAQPVIRVPIFGNVAPTLLIDPPVILLRQDGTARGQERRVKLQASVQDELVIQGLSCDLDAIKATIDPESQKRYRHLRWLNIELTGKLPTGRHEGSLSVKTGIKGAEQLTIPIVVEVP